jgi:ribosomal protein S16
VPKLKLSNDEFDPDELDVEYDDTSYETYDGEVPKTGTLVTARVTKCWWTYSQNDNPMIKAIAVAEDGDNGLEEYDGLPIWENITFTPSAAFRYQPFLRAFGLTLKDVKTKTIVADEEDNLGTPIEKIGTWKPGSDDALCQIVIKKDRYDGEWQAKVGKILPYDEPEEEAEEEEKPARRKPATRKPASRSRRAEPEPEEDEDEDEEEEAPPTKARGRTARGRASAASTRRAPKGRSRRSSDDEDEPPF